MVPNINLIGARKISVINNIIKKCVKKFPSEFDKKGCAIDDFRHWKAVELRSFLLYSGEVVLKDILPEDKYEKYSFTSHFAFFYRQTVIGIRYSLLVVASTILYREFKIFLAFIMSFSMFIIFYILPMTVFF